MYVMVIIDTNHLSLPGPGNSSLWPSIHPLAGIWHLTWLHLSAHSKVIQGVQPSTCKVYGYAQHTFLQFCHCYGLLPVPVDQEKLLYFATFLADDRGLQHRTIVDYLYGVQVLHIDMGLPDPLKSALQLQICLWAIHIQSNPESHRLAFTYDLLLLAQLLHQFPVQQVLWASLTMTLISDSFRQVKSQWIRNALTHMPLVHPGHVAQHYNPVDTTIHHCPSEIQQFRPLWTRWQYDHWLLQHPSLWCLHHMGPYTGPLGKLDLPNSTILPTIQPSTLQDHYSGPYKRHVDQIRSQPFPL